jgi:polysaccharide export outer membrane protein
MEIILNLFRKDKQNVDTKHIAVYLIRYLRWLSTLCFVQILVGCASSSVTENNTVPSSLPKQQNTSEMRELNIEQDLKYVQSLHNLDQSDYVIAPGDKFNIYVYNEKDLDTKGIIVKMDGTITCKLIGEIQVKNNTIPQATRKIEENLKRYIHYPKVSLIPYEMKSSSFTIMGKVTKPGFYYFDGSMRLADAIAKAEGLSVGVFDNNTIELADLEHSFIRRGEEVLPIDFEALLRKGNATMNIPLINGDYIFIPSAMNQEVYIIGEVEKQGYFGYKPNMTAGRLLAHAEGIKNSAGDEILIIRGNLQHPKVYSVSRSAILNGEIRDFRLQPNDIIYVPKGILGKWNAILSEIMPTIEAGLYAFDLDKEISIRR